MTQYSVASVDTAKKMNGEAIKEKQASMEHPLHLETPLLRSSRLSKKVGCSVWLKIEALQNSGSFKDRGLGLLCQKAVKNGCTQFVSSSGGNAGLAATYCAQQLGKPITVVVPMTTPDFIVKLLEERGATVEVVGQAWDDANVRALEIASSPGAVLIHPFDHPDIWTGHASMVDEIQTQLRGVVPDLVVLSVGGGGLMNGVLEGLHRVGWKDVPVLAMETEGCHSLNLCEEVGEWTQLDKITSVARCLGAKRVSQKSFEWLSQHNVVPAIISDRDAISACVNLADDHRMLVPPACGAALAALYGDTIPKLQKAGKLPEKLTNIVAILCGGSGVNLETIDQWKKDYDL